MKLINRFELASRSTPELRCMLREMFNALAANAPESPESKYTLASIEMIRAELNARQPGP